MKIDSTLLEKSTKNKSKQVTYPYQEPLQRLLNAVWICFFITIPGLIDVAYSYLNLEDFFYPCYYANMISINDTLQIQYRFNETQKEIHSYKSLLSLAEISVIRSDKYSLLLQNVTEISAALNKEFNYHKNHWKECYNENLFKFDNKVIGCQLGIVILGFATVLYQTIKCLQYMSKIKNLNLTKKQKEVYEKDWNGLNAFKIKLIIKCFMLIFLISLVILFSLRLFYSHPRFVEMPFFS